MTESIAAFNDKIKSILRRSKSSGCLVSVLSLDANGGIHSTLKDLFEQQILRHR